ncbi:hypothetical protein BZA77DRAFT_317001 [Pyronema omphalodes]|nr:hypothetical protein BZA77DRAFT_317001 [Pyronema omphalodes]
MEHGDIHSPTINLRSGQSAPAGGKDSGATGATVATGTTTSTTSTSTSTSTADTAAHVFQLMKTKEAIEEELKALGSVLDSHKVTMKTSLTTFDGYPRDDIDIAQIRTTRTRIIRLRNDYKDIMKQIELGLHAHHAAISAASEKEAEEEAEKAAAAAAAAATEKLASGSSLTSAVVTATAEVTTPFAKINSVESESPAEEAGLKRGDYLKKFGEVNALNHDGLKALAKEVTRNEGKEIPLLISRDNQDIQLSLTPKSWSGRGKLGCHILPL